MEGGEAAPGLSLAPHLPVCPLPCGSRASPSGPAPDEAGVRSEPLWNRKLPRLQAGPEGPALHPEGFSSRPWPPWPGWQSGGGGAVHCPSFCLQEPVTKDPVAWEPRMGTRPAVRCARPHACLSPAWKPHFCSQEVPALGLQLLGS